MHSMDALPILSTSIDGKKRQCWKPSSPRNSKRQDNLTVHNIILRNITEASDASTSMKPYIKKDNGRAEIKVLHRRYEDVAMQEQYGRKANRTIETIQYRNERAMTFETFASKIVKSVDELKNEIGACTTLTLLRSSGRGSTMLN